MDIDSEHLGIPEAKHLHWLQLLSLLPRKVWSFPQEVIGIANIVLKQNTTVDKVCPLGLSYFFLYNVMHVSNICNMINLMVLLIEVDEFIYEGYSIIKYSDNQLVLRTACCGRVQTSWDGLYQVLLGTQNWSGWEWD